jgi:hypothetical protein
VSEESAQIIEYPSPAPVAPANPIPGPIVMAIAAIMRSLEAVEKSNKNTHGGYNFASTDDIYAAVTKKMGEIGLVVIAMEEAPPEIKTVVGKEGKPAQWMRISHLFILATKDATWTDPRCRRTLTLQITGPQSFQAAQSYNEKAFLRSLFKIPTGDMDLDALPEGFEFNPLQFNAPKAPPPAPAGAEDSLKSDETTVKEMTAQKPPPDMREVLKNVEAAMSLAQDTKALNTIVDAFNKKYDGYIDQQVGANLDVLYDASVARLTKKK